MYFSEVGADDYILSIFLAARAASPTPVEYALESKVCDEIRFAVAPECWHEFPGYFFGTTMLVAEGILSTFSVPSATVFCVPMSFAFLSSLGFVVVLVVASHESSSSTALRNAFAIFVERLLSTNTPSPRRTSRYALRASGDSLVKISAVRSAKSAA